MYLKGFIKFFICQCVSPTIVKWASNSDEAGILNGATRESTNYNGMTITWSGYKGNGTELGYEYIKISGVTTNNLVMKAYGYEAGHTTVLYSWGKDYPSLAKKETNKQTVLYNTFAQI